MRDVYKSATVKLTAWYLLIVMVISLMFSGVVYRVAHNELAWTLNNQAARIYREYPVFSHSSFFLRDDDLSASSRHLLLNLLYFNILVLFAAGFASYWLARHTLEPIEASNERQKRFVADASHELRTPVTALKMETEVALMDGTASKETLRAALQSNLEEADKLDTLLNSLLRLSRLETQEIQHTFTRLSMLATCSTAIEHVRQVAANKHIKITNSVTDHAVMGDEASLVQLLVIVLDNAIKYSHEHSTIALTSASNGHEARITVSDTGIGIEPTALEHVFDRFYRADKARRSNNGYGLGLSIAKYIADSHNGTIILSSTPGKGTKATISLPLAAEQK